ncbi:MAG: ATPase, T2SS/T4P/T4SS family [Bacillota bacterium]
MQVQTCDSIDRLRLLVIDRVRSESREILRQPGKHKPYLESKAHLIARSAGIECSVDMIREVVEDLLGYGPINPLMESGTVTEVQISRYDKVYVEESGILLPTNVRFRNEKHLRTLAEKIALTSGRRLDESTPYVDTKLPDGTRVNITIPPISSNGATISFRRFPHPYTMEELVESGTVDDEAFAYTTEVVKYGLNIAAIGSMSSGKTTLVNGLIELIGQTHGQHASVVTYEDPVELQPRHENIRQYEARPPNIEGKGGITIKKLAQTLMLRTRADWIIFGEAKGAEAYYIVDMMNTGHSAMMTFHSDDCLSAVMFRLPAMILMSEEGRSEGRDSALSRTASALDVVFHCAKVLEGSRVVRRVVQVAEVLVKSLPTGLVVPDVRVVFNRKDGKLQQVVESKVFQKRRGWQ